MQKELFPLSLFFMGLLLSATPLFGKAHANANAGYFSTSGEGEGKSGIRLHRFDLGFQGRASKTKVYFKLNIVDPYTGTVTAPAPADNSLGATKIEDAWVQYSFMRELAIKLGYEDAHWAFDGRNSPVWSGIRLDRAETFQKLELSGSVSGFSYAFMIWSDPADAESSIEDSYSLLASYKFSSSFKLGAIMRKKKEGAVSKNGTTFFISYKYGGYLHLQLKRTDFLKATSETGGEAMSLGVSYRIDRKMQLKGFYNTLKPVNAEKDRAIMDLAFWYKVESKIGLYAQYVSIGAETEEGSDSSILALGMEAKI